MVTTYAEYLAQVAPEPEVVEAGASPPSSNDLHERAAVRIHVEEGPQGLRVWLGVDGTPAEVSARVAAVTAELQRECGRGGLRLAAVTCNGVPLSLPNGKET